MNKLLMKALACSGTLLCASAFATPTDFHRTMHGNLYEAGSLAGSFDYEFHYNIVPDHVGTIIDPLNSVGNVQAYAPFPGFSNQFFANLTLYSNSGAVVQTASDMPIYRFLVINDVETTLGHPHDAFEIDTHSLFGDVQLTFLTLDALTLADTSLNSILIQDTYRDIIAPANGDVNPMAGQPTRWQFSFGQTSTVSEPISNTPTPGTLPLVGLSLGTLAWVGRARRSPAPVRPAT